MSSPDRQDPSSEGRIWVGTSGWMYRDWRDLVYPEGLPKRLWLHHLQPPFPDDRDQRRFDFPRPRRSDRWRLEVPPGFRFAVKMAST